MLKLILFLCLFVFGCLAKNPNLVLEEIVEQENVKEDPDVVDLSISLHIHSLWNNTMIENWEHYRKAVENLRKKLPNLKTLRPSGGHSFNYRNATLLQLRCDLLLVHNALDAITKQIQNLGLQIDGSVDASLNYTLFHFIAESNFNSTGYEKVLEEIFGLSTTIHQISSIFTDKLYAAELHYQLNGVQIQLVVHTLSTASVEKVQLEHGRLDHQSDKWLDVQSKLIPSEN